jgi:hypothetical protein
MLSAVLVMLAALTTSFSVLLVMLCAALSTMLLVGLAMALAMTLSVLLTMGLSATTSRRWSGSFNSCNYRLY